MGREWMIWFFFFNDTATTEIYTLSLHDALPIWPTLKASRCSSSTIRIARRISGCGRRPSSATGGSPCRTVPPVSSARSEEHTSELQSRQYLVCRLLLEKKKTLQ